MNQDMNNTEQIIRALLSGSDNAPNQDALNEDAWFCAEDALEASNLSIRVDGVGKLALPLSRESIARLQAMASPAQFGLREQTLLDKSVRDTLEISADKIQIDYDDGVMADLLVNAAATMGLAPDAQLVPHLHNLLIYGPGQFFKPHQDSEKLPGMVATLVIVLPSPHIGGALRIAHQGDEHLFESENLDEQDLKCIVFYADCDHEIRKVRQGFRVSLTFNLVLESSGDFLAGADGRAAQVINPALEAALADYFAPQPEGQSSLPKLACFLDHRYSEHGLRWDLLKGTDQQHARALCLAAQQLDLVPHLALAEIHHCYSAMGDEDDPEPEELIDSDTRLTYWVDLQNRSVNLRECYLRDTETCWLTDLDEDDYDDTEYEGWTGNAGQTVDYWYRRAAVVLWPRSADVAMQFRYNYNTALAGLLALAEKPGNVAIVADTIVLAGGYLHRFDWRDPFPNQVKAFMQIALYVNNPETALTCLQPFGITDVDEAVASDLVRLQAAYGTDWCLQLMARWKGNKPQLPAKVAVELKIDRLVQQLLAETSTAANDGAGAGAMPLATYMLQAHLAICLDKDALEMRETPEARLKSAAQRNSNIHGLIHACATLGDEGIAGSIVNHLISQPRLYCAPDLAEILLELPQAGAALAPLAELRQHLVLALRQEMLKGARAKTDWSLDPETSCDCVYCKPLAIFVRSVGEAQGIWGLAAQNRDHVMRHFGSLGLPLDFEVRKQGSPHKLVVTKNPRLHQDAQERYQRGLALGARLEG